MPSSTPLTLVLINDYAVVVEGLKPVLAPFSDRVRVVDLAVGHSSDAPADIALYDTFAADLAFGGDFSARRLVLWTLTVSPHFVAAARANGASGVLSKAMSPGELVDALERIHAGEMVVIDGAQDPEGWGDWPGRAAGLSEREAEIIALITRGLSNEEIAKAAYLSINTVKSYIRAAYRKMGVDSRSRAILWAIDRGFTTRSGAPCVDAKNELRLPERSEGQESGPSPRERQNRSEFA